MYKSGFANPVKDTTAQLTGEQKAAAAQSGYGIPYISEEAKFVEAQRLANQKRIDDLLGLAPIIK